MRTCRKVEIQLAVTVICGKIRRTVNCNGLFIRIINNKGINVLCAVGGSYVSTVGKYIAFRVNNFNTVSYCRSAVFIEFSALRQNRAAAYDYT